MSANRRAIVSVTTEQLANLLRLPKDATIRFVSQDMATGGDTVSIYIEGAGWHVGIGMVAAQTKVQFMHDGSIDLGLPE